MSRLWGYAWKSTDGQRHEDVLDAPSRDEAFALLRKQGIKPIKVFPVERKRDRVLKIARRLGILVAVLVLVVFSFVYGRRTERHAGISPVLVLGETNATSTVIAPVPRQQIQLDGVDLAAVFRYEGERYLVRFVAPGVVTREPCAVPADFVEAVRTPVMRTSDDDAHCVLLKGIVAGLKQEAVLYLASGKSVEQIGEWLEMRQRMESDFRKQLIMGRDRNAASLPALNAKLKSLGLAEIAP